MPLFRVGPTRQLFRLGPTQQPDWRKASFCASGECVEVTQQNGMILLRDSKKPRARPQHYTAEEWQSFVLGVKAGEFDDLS